jgi:hypothetical protein
MVAVSVVYLVAFLQAGTFPDASGWVGHGIGIAGFILMIMAETLYTIRKRLSDARWGSMASWLRFHIVTGLVGPYMVLLHTSMKFGGLAGIVMLLTLVVVASGVVGRYIYTATPHEYEPLYTPATSGARPAARVSGIASARGMLAAWRAVHLPMTWLLFATAAVHAVAALYYATLQR